MEVVRSYVPSREKSVKLTMLSLRESSVLSLRLVGMVGGGGASVALVIGGESSMEGGCELESIREVEVGRDHHLASAVFIRI